MRAAAKRAAKRELAATSAACAPLGINGLFSTCASDIGTWDVDLAISPQKWAACPGGKVDDPYSPFERDPWDTFDDEVLREHFAMASVAKQKPIPQHRSYTSVLAMPCQGGTAEDLAELE